MWISKKRFRAECLAEYHMGLRQGIGIGRNQIRCQLIAASNRRKNAAVPATAETPANKVVVISTTGSATDE